MCEKSFDVERYGGKWYEVAKTPFKWEQGCSSATAEYTWDKERNILKIKNNCLDENKNVIFSRSGEAKKITNMEGFPKFKVVFNDGLPADKSDDLWNYGVLFTDYNNYAIVSGPTYNHAEPDHKTQLWILSRKPTISAKDALYLLDKVKSFGFDPNTLISQPSVLHK